MFNVNNTYIRISGCIINVPLNQDGIVIGTYNVALKERLFPYICYKKLINKWK